MFFMEGSEKKGLLVLLLVVVVLIVVVLSSTGNVTPTGNFIFDSSDTASEIGDRGFGIWNFLFEEGEYFTVDDVSDVSVIAVGYTGDPDRPYRFASSVMITDESGDNVYVPISEVVNLRVPGGWILFDDLGRRVDYDVEIDYGNYVLLRLSEPREVTQNPESFSMHYEDGNLVSKFNYEVYYDDEDLDVTEIEVSLVEGKGGLEFHSSRISGGEENNYETASDSDGRSKRGDIEFIDILEPKGLLARGSPGPFGNVNVLGQKGAEKITRLRERAKSGKTRPNPLSIPLGKKFRIEPDITKGRPGVNIKGKL